MGAQVSATRWVSAADMRRWRACTADEWAARCPWGRRLRQPVTEWAHPSLEIPAPEIAWVMARIDRRRFALVAWYILSDVFEHGTTARIDEALRYLHKVGTGKRPPRFTRKLSDDGSLVAALRYCVSAITTDNADKRAHFASEGIFYLRSWLGGDIETRARLAHWWKIAGSDAKCGDVQHTRQLRLPFFGSDSQ
jgi:hypothetical protein